MTAMVPLTSHARWPRAVVALVAARAVNQIGAFALSFLTIALVEVHGAALTTAGWVVALFGLATIPSRLLGGWLTARIGHRPTIVTGLVGCALALVVIATSPGLGGAAVGALLLGLAFEIYEPPSQALLADLVPPERRPEAFGLLGAALAAAAVAAGALAALLGGVDLRLLFVADAVSCVAAAILVLVLVEEPHAAAPAPGPRSVSGHRPWRDRRLLLMLAAGTGNALVWTFATTTLPVTVVARGHEPAFTGWLLALSALVTIAGQRLLRTAAFAPFRMIALGLVAVAVGFAALAYAGGVVALAAGAALVALGQVFLLGPPFAIVAGLAERSSRAAYLAAFGISWGIAQTAGPVISTHLLEVSLPGAWLAGAALCAVLAAIQPLVARAVATDDSGGVVRSVRP
ncbi:MULTISPECIES: MFS transporter [unclassified Nocardioides]|uniref:MFS transporter n=1 Tax=unclassified Nocardioides TaxID=2615069 RepID=UPI0036088973